MVIKIDYREAKLIAAIEPLLASDGSEAVIENLLLGDVALYKTNRAPVPVVESVDSGPDPGPVSDPGPDVIIERKTIADMVASLKDGRYAEQKARLDACPVPNHNIMFLVEGPRTGADHVHAAVFSLFYNHGFGVLFSCTVGDSARIIRAFDRKLNKDPPSRTAYYRLDQGGIGGGGIGGIGGISSTFADYAACLKPEKKANVCRENIWIIMLQQIPHVSSSIARALMDDFGSLPALIESAVSEPERLDTFKLVDPVSGKSRKLSSRVITNIRELLL
jgi:ERCC4-type nuclease